MNTHKLHWDVGRIALASRLNLNSDIRHLQVLYSLSSKTDHIRVTTMKKLDKGLFHPKLEVPRLTRLGRDRTWASTIEKSHLNSLLMLFGTSTYDLVTMPYKRYNSSLPVRVMPGLRLAPLRPVEFSSERISLGFTRKEMATIFSYNIAKFNMILLRIHYL
jgi:hypothetical protein